MLVWCCKCNKRAEMMHAPTDPRVQRTRKLLKDALVELSSERGFDAVTVAEIVRHAKVNRATFYRHYQDKYALVEEIFQEAIDRLRHDLKPPSAEALDLALQDPPERLVKLFEHFAEHKHLYRALLGGNGSSWFAARMREQFTEFLEQREQFLIQPHPKEQDKDESGMPKRVG